MNTAWLADSRTKTLLVRIRKTLFGRICNNITNNVANRDLMPRKSAMNIQYTNGLHKLFKQILFLLTHKTPTRA